MEACENSGDKFRFLYADQGHRRRSLAGLGREGCDHRQASGFEEKIRKFYIEQQAYPGTYEVEEFNRDHLKLHFTESGHLPGSHGKQKTSLCDRRQGELREVRLRRPLSDRIGDRQKTDRFFHSHKKTVHLSSKYLIDLSQ
jgi:hypothetical protein